ncbi:MAG: hypothetical protein P1V97_12660, partial [Planctomycetota bacterium]|nr:hypothetical protein [Planctomycetota bacterium]
MKRLLILVLSLGLGHAVFAQEAKEPSPGGIALSEWVKRLNHKERAERLAASKALGVLGKEGVPAVEAILLTSLDRGLLKESYPHTEAIKKMGDAAIPALIAMLGHKNRRAVSSAAQILGQMKPKGPDALKNAAESDDELVRKGALLGLLYAVGNADLKEAQKLVDGVKWDSTDSTALYKLRVAESLAGKGDKASWLILKSALKSEVKERRELAVGGFRSGGDGGLPILHEFFEENDRDTLATLLSPDA